MNKELKLAYQIAILKSKIMFFSNVVGVICEELLDEQMKGNENIAQIRDRLRDLETLMKEESRSDINI